MKRLALVLVCLALPASALASTGNPVRVDPNRVMVWTCYMPSVSVAALDGRPLSHTSERGDGWYEDSYGRGEHHVVVGSQVASDGHAVTYVENQRRRTVLFSGTCS